MTVNVKAYYIDWWPDVRCAGSIPERMFKITYSSPYASHETATSHIVKGQKKTTVSRHIPNRVYTK